MTDSIRSAIVYLTYNGIYNFTNGIGTQSQLLLSGLEHLKDVEGIRYWAKHFKPVGSIGVYCIVRDVRHTNEFSGRTRRELPQRMKP